MEDQTMKMPPIKLCGCGTCNDAVDAALRFAEENFNGEHGECPIWYAAVVEALGIIVHHRLVAWADNHFGDIDRASDSAMASREKIERLVPTAYFHNHEHNKRLADFVAKSTGNDRTREIVEEGPGVSNIEDGLLMAMNEERREAVEGKLGEFLNSRITADDVADMGELDLPVHKYVMALADTPDKRKTH